MCIIGIKIKGADFIPAETVINCMTNNPDGFSMAWNENGQLETFKSLDREEFIRRYVDLTARLDPRLTAMVIHARIATHGSVKLSNCHCWTGGGFAFAHNGILGNVPNRDDLTDSETFFRDYFLPVYEKCGTETAFRIAKSVAGSSRFAFINADGALALIGDYQKTELKDCKGHYYFSNGNYVARSLYSFGYQRTSPLGAPSHSPALPAKRLQPGAGAGPLSVSRDEKGRVRYSTAPSGKKSKENDQSMPSLFGKDGRLHRDPI